MEANEKTALVIDHDVYFIDILSDSLMVFDGEVENLVSDGPYPLRDGEPVFDQVNITFRRDHDSKRPHK